MSWWTRSVGSIVLGLFLAWTVSGCCSTTPESSPLPAPPGRPDELVLTSPIESWTLYESLDLGFGETMIMVTLPKEDLDRIITNRLRWRAYSMAWEVQRLGKVQGDVAEVTSGRSP